MQGLKEAIDNKLFPALIKHQLNDAEIDLVCLPDRLGGISFDHPVNDSALKHATSIECTANLTNQIKANGSNVMGSIRQDSTSKMAIRQHQRASMKDKADIIQARLSLLKQQAIVLAREKGGSSTLMTIPKAEHGLYFKIKADFHDHIYLTGHWRGYTLACPCGGKYSVDHAQICKLSELFHMHHDEVTDFLAACMEELHTDVEVEPMLQPLIGESFSHRTANAELDAQVDIQVRSFRTQSQMFILIQGCFTPMHQATGPDLSLRSIAIWRRQRNTSMERQ